MVLPTEGQAHVSLATWHARLGHPNVQLIRKMSRHGIVKGLGNIHKEKDFDCGACGAAKQEGFSPIFSKQSRAGLRAISYRLMCPTEDGLMTNDRSYVLTILDDYSRYSGIDSTYGEANQKQGEGYPV
jgi:hypothetical protein